MKSTNERTLEDIEERASQLAEAAQRIRDRTYAGARVIEIAPIAEVIANNPNAWINPADRSAQTGTTGIKPSAELSQVEPENERKEKMKADKTVKVKKESRGADDDNAKSMRNKLKIKRSKSPRKSGDSSSTEEASKDDEPKITKNE